MKTKKLQPVPVNWAVPNWKHAASGIRCRADWKGAHVYHTEVGWIIAHSQAHANDTAREVLESRADYDQDAPQEETLFDASYEH